MSRWVEEHTGTSKLTEMYNQLESMLLSGKLSSPKHQLVSFNEETTHTVFSQAIKGFRGDKFIFDMRDGK